jgi:hypothetical protein
MKKIGLVFNMIGVAILGFQPQVTLWDVGTAAKYPGLNILGWGLLFFGFLMMFLVEAKIDKKKIRKLIVDLTK